MTAKALDEALAAAFERHRPSLIGLAYRMLGSLAEAQDIAQETFLRFRRAVEEKQTEVENVGAFLHKVAARLCLDQIKSSQFRRETYVGPWLPEPLVEDVSTLGSASPRAEVLHDVSYALLLTLDRLTPTERATFLLHDVFDLSFSEVAEAISQEEATCRQLAARARQRLQALEPRFTPPPQDAKRLVESFLYAVATGDVGSVKSLLSEDAVMYSDGGGKVQAALKPVEGADRISRFFVGIRAKYPSVSFSFRAVWVNGLPGIVLYREGKLDQVLAFQFDATAAIEAIYITRNPDKLTHAALARLAPTAAGGA